MTTANTTQLYKNEIRRKVKAGIYPRWAFEEVALPRQFAVKEKTTLGFKEAKRIRRAYVCWKQRNNIVTLGPHRDKDGKVIRQRKFLRPILTIDLLTKS